MRDGLLTAPEAGARRGLTPGCPRLPKAPEELVVSWSPGGHRQPRQQRGWEGDAQTSLFCWARWTQGAAAPCPGPAPSVSRAWHSDALRGGDCGPPATGLRSGGAVPTHCPRGWGVGTPQTHLHLLLGVQLLPEGLHARRKAQEALDALPEELLVVGLHRLLLPRLLPPPLLHEAPPGSPGLQGEER